jgi:adenosylcobinamide-GDP ribazoletransferase
LWVLTLAGHSSQASAWVAAVLSTVATVLMTGGFHEDGLADVADGLGGSLQRERSLVIMKDSRVGAFGVLALVLVLALKFALLALLAGQGGAAAWTDVAVAIVTAHVLSRFVPLWLIRWLPHVGDDATSKSKPLADQISAGALGVAFLWSIPAVLLIWWLMGAIKTVVSLIFLMLTLAWMYRWFQRRLQGFTGDCLGATQQVGELAFYLGLALAPAFS